MTKSLDHIARRAVSPLSWRVRNRRILISTLPLAIVVWAAFLLLLSLALIVRKLAQFLKLVWTMPPRARTSNFYGYGPARRPSPVLPPRRIGVEELFARNADKREGNGGPRNFEPIKSEVAGGR